MKQIIQYAAAALVAAALALPAEAKIWRVNNNGFSADYSTIRAANDDPNVMAGDTLHVEGSNTPYDGPTINKPLVIIGPGYFLTENPKTSSNGQVAVVEGITFKSQAEHSQLIGVIISRYDANIEGSNITIKRCQIYSRINIEGWNVTSNVHILNNFFVRYTSCTDCSAINIQYSNVPANLRINNNIFQNALLLFDDATSVIAECNNNIFDVPAITGKPSIRMYTSSFRNNILTTSTATVKINGITDFNTNPNSAVSYNVSASQAIQFGTVNNNIGVTNMAANLFVPVAGNSTDGKYQLKSGSPASGNGSDGADRGAFGGAAVSNRYTLSGLAPVPVIYDINTTGVSSPTNGLPVTIKARSIQ